jgi:hypothetical protein
MTCLVRKWAVVVPLLFVAVLASAVPAGRIVLLQYISGSVSIQPRGTGSWVAAVSNRPLTMSDNLWTDKASRAELNVGTGIIRMNSETSLTIVNADIHTIQLKINQGSLHLHVRHLFGGEIYEVDSSNGAFTLTKSGDYRIDVDPKTDTTTITTWKGEGSITGERRAIRVRSREQVRITGVSADYDRHGAPAPDAFDEWCRVRNTRQDSAYPAMYPPYPPFYPPSGVIVYGPRPWH